MKRLSLLLLAFLLPLCLSAQKTIVSGQVEKNPNQPVMLIVYRFDLDEMKEVETIHQVACKTDNRFTFVLDDIRLPLTRCRLGFRNEGVTLMLSPGDSLNAGFTFGNIDSTVTYSGNRAGIEEYLKRYQLAFSKWQRDKFFGDLPRDTCLLNGLRQWYDRKTDFLRQANAEGLVDDSFLTIEKERLTYDYLNQMMGADIRHACGDSLWNSRIRLEMTLGRINRDSTWLQVPEYRAFANNYMDVLLWNEKAGKAALNDRLKLAGENLSGAVLTWYDFSQISEAIGLSRSMSDKKLLHNYFISHSDDLRLVSLLRNLPVRYSLPRTYFQIEKIFRFLLAFILITGIALTLYISVRLLLNSPKQNKITSIQLFVILTGLSIITALYLIWGFSHSSHLFAVPLALSYIGFALINVLYLVPVTLKKKKWQFFLAEFLASVVFFGVMILLTQYFGHSTRRMGKYLDFTLTLGGAFILLGSFYLHYLIRAHREGKRLLDLAREKQIEWEVIVHTVLVYLLLGTSLAYSVGYRTINPLIMTIMGLSVFYLHGFRLIPAVLRDRKILKYVGWTLGIGIGVILVVSIPYRIRLVQVLGQNGLVSNISTMFGWPDEFALKGALSLQLLIIPAWIYAIVRIQLLQKNIGFGLFQKKQAELNQLRSQVNPHFLFNSLNTLYAFALKENNPKTAEYIARLANLMRFLVDDMSRERIPVSDEIRYIRDYIDIQAIRCSVTPEIGFDDEIGDDTTLQIAPMLMIPFVENAFKHGINPNGGSQLIIRFAREGNRFRFFIENSVSHDFESFYKEKGFGVGIGNVRQRLQHLYPGRHILHIENTEERFAVSLDIDLG